MKVSFSDAKSSNRPQKRLCVNHDTRLCVPTIENPSVETISDAYAKCQAVFLPNYITGFYGKTTSEESTRLDWKGVGNLYNHLNSKDKTSFCLENSKGFDHASASCTFATASEFLRPQITEEVAYCSFLIQHDKVALARLLRRLPVAELREQRSDDAAATTLESDDGGKNQKLPREKWDYEPCVWVFFGRNNGPSQDCSEDLMGRPEHTDSISHDGTWHYQLSGTKRWLLRPTRKLKEHYQKVLTEKKLTATTTGEEDETANNDIGVAGEDKEDPIEHHIQIDCRQGDVLIVNTRLWNHQTILPPQPNPSVSYARDFWISPRQTSTGVTTGSSTDINSEGGPTSYTSPASEMTNLDGLYATDDIEADTIIFKETDMPDCALHRSSTDANCTVVELEDGTQAVVSRRKIRAGEFFCISQSDDEDDDEEESLSCGFNSSEE